MSTFRLLTAFWIVTLMVALAHADVRLPHVIGDHMVLQRGREAPIWGWAAPDEAVAVSFAGQVKQTKADAAGKWRVTLDAMEASAQPREMVVRGDNEIKLTDILVGEVWLCSGQSNMEWSVGGAMNAQEEIAAADYPTIRLFHVPRRAAGTPREDVDADVNAGLGVWKATTPGNVKGFSAVGYFFGRHLHKELDGVPIGLIASAWGGTRIEPWTPVEGFRLTEDWSKLADWAEQSHRGYLAAKTQALKDYEQWLPKAQAAASDGRQIPDPPQWPKDPVANAGASTGLFNGMIAPLAPFAIRGAVWYQGESNRGNGMAYHELMRALIGGWRKVWNAQPDGLHFYFVQLAPFNYGNHPTALSEIWEAQTKTMQTVPHTGMAVTTDIGDVKDIHPRNKQEVGRRLALWALAKTYGQKNIVYSGPIMKDVKFEGGQAIVTFDHLGGGLASRDDKPLTHFELAGADKQFFPATAKIEGDRVVVASDDVKEPVALRFGWHHTAEPNLMNSEGLPASPFRTDEW